MTIESRVRRLEDKLSTSGPIPAWAYEAAGRERSLTDTLNTICEAINRNVRQIDIDRGVTPGPGIPLLDLPDIETKAREIFDQYPTYEAWFEAHIAPPSEEVKAKVDEIFRQAGYDGGHNA